MGRLVAAMLDGQTDFPGYELISAERISDVARLDRLVGQRREFRKSNRENLARNYRHSVFYQSDLLEEARASAADSLTLPPELPATEPLLTRVSDAMFRAEVKRARDKNAATAYEASAFSLLRRRPDAHGPCRQAAAETRRLQRPDCLEPLTRPHRHCRRLD